MIATVVNALAVIAGSLLGMLLQQYLCRPATHGQNHLGLHQFHLAAQVVLALLQLGRLGQAGIGRAA